MLTSYCSVFNPDSMYYCFYFRIWLSSDWSGILLRTFVSIWWCWRCEFDWLDFVES